MGKREVLDDLTRGGHGLPEYFETVRKDIGRAGFHHRNLGTSLSKQGINAIKRGNRDAIATCKTEILRSLNALDDAQLPARMRIDFMMDVSQEYAELAFVERFYPRIIWGVALEGVPSDAITPEFLNIPPQAWISGLCDTPGELSKMILDYRASHPLRPSEDILILQRLIEVISEIYEYLDENFRDAYEAAISSSGDRRFANTFRAKLMNIDKLLVARKEEYLSLQTLLAHEKRMQDMLSVFRDNDLVT